MGAMSYYLLAVVAAAPDVGAAAEGGGETPLWIYDGTGMTGEQVAVVRDGHVVVLWDVSAWAAAAACQRDVTVWLACPPPRPRG